MALGWSSWADRDTVNEPDFFFSQEEEVFISKELSLQKQKLSQPNLTNVSQTCEVVPSGLIILSVVIDQSWAH